MVLFICPGQSLTVLCINLDPSWYIASALRGEPAVLLIIMISLAMSLQFSDYKHCRQYRQCVGRTVKILLSPATGDNAGSKPSCR